MGASKPVNDTARELSRETSRIDWAGFLGETLALLDEVDVLHGGSVVEALVSRLADRASAPPSWPAPVTVDLREELAEHRRRAREGDAVSARRVAEILQLLDRDEESVAWWHRAADAGDPDALFYVREVLPR